MKPLYLLAITTSLLVVATKPASAQVLVLNDGGTSWTVAPDSFTSDSSGISTLSESSPNFVADLSTLGLPASLPNTGSGWVFQNGSGTLVIAKPAGNSAPALALGDPFVAYSYSFYNSTATTQNFSMQFVSSFPLTTYSAANPSYSRASLGFTLTDGGDSSTVTASATETATLSNMATDSTNAGVDLTIPQQTADQDDTTSLSTRTAGYPGYLMGPDGSFNTLTVTISGTYSAGADVSVTGRADVIPEPSTWALALGGGAVLLFRRRHFIA